MSTRTSIRALALAATFATASMADAQKLTGPNPTAAPPTPVTLDLTGLFQAKFVKVGDDVFIGGQPTERALRELKAQGVTTVVNLRSPQEMQSDVKYDEAALIKSLGMKYVYLPMRGTSDLPYAPSAVKEFTKAMKETDGKLLLHCTVAWRASHLWAAYLIEERHVPAQTAIEQTRLVNLMDEHRMDAGGQPLELFLGRKVPGLGQPK
jgi:uncharacterized protein (TIGR01244 family)